MAQPTAPAKNTQRRRLGARRRLPDRSQPTDLQRFRHYVPNHLQSPRTRYLNASTHQRSRPRFPNIRRAPRHNIVIIASRTSSSLLKRLHHAPEIARSPLNPPSFFSTQARAENIRVNFVVTRQLPRTLVREKQCHQRETRQVNSMISIQKTPSPSKPGSQPDGNLLQIV